MPQPNVPVGTFRANNQQEATVTCDLLLLLSFIQVFGIMTWTRCTLYLLVLPVTATHARPLHTSAQRRRARVPARRVPRTPFKPVSCPMR